jgi:hypothetical protein
MKTLALQQELVSYKSDSTTAYTILCKIQSRKLNELLEVVYKSGS